jgi:hypothetical protein
MPMADTQTSAANGPAPKLGQGNVTFELDGHTFEMKPTINAMRVLSTKYGGLQAVVDKVAQLDIQAIEDVIVMGLGPSYQSARQRKELMDKVFGAGLTDDTGAFALTCQKYVISLMRGGRPLNLDKEEGEGNEPMGNAKSSS